MKQAVVLLDNIRSTYNVGAIFRTADGAGVEKMVLVGYTPAPVDRFGRAEPKIAKTSLGASATVPWQAVTSYDEALALLATYTQDGYTIVAVEQGKDSVLLHDFTVPEKVLWSRPFCYSLAVSAASSSFTTSASLHFSRLPWGPMMYGSVPLPEISTYPPSGHSSIAV